MAIQSGIKAQIAEALKLLRVHHGMKQVELAKGVGVSPQYISRLERGYSSVTLNTIERYSEYFNIRISSIIYIAEHLPCPHLRNRRQSPCSHATKILDIEWSKQDLRQELVRSL